MRSLWMPAHIASLLAVGCSSATASEWELRSSNTSNSSHVSLRGSVLIEPSNFSAPQVDVKPKDLSYEKTASLDNASALRPAEQDTFKDRVEPKKAGQEKSKIGAIATARLDEQVFEKKRPTRDSSADTTNARNQNFEIEHILKEQKRLEELEIKTDKQTVTTYMPLKGPKESLTSALIKAYNENPDLNQQRANVRIRDEDVPKAASGYRPKLAVNGNAGLQSTKVHTGSGLDPNRGVRTYLDDGYFAQPRGASFQVSQTLFDGNRTKSAVSQAEAGVFAARAGLRGVEQSVLLKGVTAYMDVLRDAAIVRLKLNNISVLQEQLKQTKTRYDQGDVTLTDYSQSEAGLAQARADYYVADSNLKVSTASYQQVIGEPPGTLEAVKPVDYLLPKNLSDAVDIAIKQHPNVLGALYQVDAAEFGVKGAESALLPTVSFSSQVTQQNDWLLGLPGTRLFQAQAGLQLNVPIFSGGGEYASIRQAKEQRGQALLVVDQQRLAVRNDVYSSFAKLRASKEALDSGQTTVKAAEAALSGVRIEALVGQRTVQDVLNAQQALLDARVKIVTYQHDYVVASYSALAALGKLNKETLELDTETYNANIHYEQVRNKWFGVNGPTGL